LHSTKQRNTSLQQIYISTERTP